jgi:hypothetical protein
MDRIKYLYVKGPKLVYTYKCMYMIVLFLMQMELFQHFNWLKNILAVSKYQLGTENDEG